MAVTKAGTDILVLNQQAGTVTTLVSGDPTNIAISSVAAHPLAFAPLSVGDGVERIAVASAGAVTVFSWDGQQFQPGTMQPAAISPAAAANGDFNGDGVDDLLIADAASGTVQLFLGDGQGGLTPVAEIPVGMGLSALATGDLNNDNALDAVALTSTGLVVLLNDGAGNLSTQTGAAVSGAGALALADFDGDGILDVAIANTSRSSVALYRGDRSGNLVGAGVYLVGKAPISLAASDLTGSGVPDLIVGDRGTQDLSILLLRAPGH